MFDFDPAAAGDFDQLKATSLGLECQCCCGIGLATNLAMLVEINTVRLAASLDDSIRQRACITRTFTHLSKATMIPPDSGGRE